MNLIPENDSYDLNAHFDKYDFKYQPLENAHDLSTFEDTDGKIGLDSIDKDDFYQAYQENIYHPSKEFTSPFPMEMFSQLKNIEVSSTQEMREESRVEENSSEDIVPQLDKASKKISKSKTDGPKKSDSKKDDPKKNAPGLHRDRALKCSKDLLKTLKKETTLAALERVFENFEASSQKRFRFMMKIFRQNAEHFAEYVRFIEYMKKKYQPDWKDKKTWVQLNEFCTIKEYPNAGKVFKQVMLAIIDRDDNNEIDIWMTKFRGNESTKEYITSVQYTKDFEHHVDKQ